MTSPKENYFVGKEFLVEIQDPADSTGATWKVIAGLRATAGDLSASFFDVTNKDNMPWSQMIAGGIRKMTISLGGVFTDAPSLSYLNWMVAEGSNSGVIIPFKLSSEDGDMYEGRFAIKTLARTGAHTAEETWTMALDSAGDITYTAPVPTLVSMAPGTLVSVDLPLPVVLTGTKFMLGAIVSVAGTPISTLATVTDCETISFTFPAHAAGSVAVLVTNPDGQATSPLAITVS